MILWEGIYCMARMHKIRSWRQIYFYQKVIPYLDMWDLLHKIVIYQLGKVLLFVVLWKCWSHLSYFIGIVLICVFLILSCKILMDYITVIAKIVLLNFRYLGNKRPALDEGWRVSRARVIMRLHYSFSKLYLCSDKYVYKGNIH